MKKAVKATLGVIGAFVVGLGILLGGLRGCRPESASKQTVERHDETQRIEPNGTGGAIVVLPDGQRLEFKTREEFVAYMESIGRPGDWGSAKIFVFEDE